MLFDFMVDQPVAFWMKNTYVSLDMMFIRGDGRILRIAERAEPLSERKLEKRTAIFSPPFRAFETEPDVFAVKTVL